MVEKGRKTVNRSAAARRAAEEKKDRVRRLRRAAILMLEIIALVMMGAGFYVISKWSQIDHVDLDAGKENGQVIVNTDIDESYVEEISKGYTTIGIFGIDSTPLADVIIICSINEDTGEIRMSSVYRDTTLKMEDGKYDKVNEAYLDGNYGVGQMNVINRNLDMNLDHYVVVNWTAVALAIETLGGIEADITEAMFREINGYITDVVAHLEGGLGGHHLTAPGVQHLSGVQAVAYCRLRHQDSDLGRTQRQREVLEQLFQKATEADFSTLVGLIDLVFPYITTTMELYDIIDLAGNIRKYHIDELIGFPFYQQSVAAHNWRMYPTNLSNNVSQLHEFLYGTKEYVPSSTVQQISAELDRMSGLEATPTTEFSDE